MKRILEGNLSIIERLQRPDPPLTAQIQTSMTLSMFKAKIHRATVTQAELYYEGSVTVDQGLLDLAGILPYEKVHIVNVNNGARLETYTIPAKAGSGTICLKWTCRSVGSNGGRSHLDFLCPDDS